MNLEIILQVLSASVAAIFLMTAFSYAVSAAAREVYKEPLLLSYVLSRLHIVTTLSNKIILGWLVHFLIGVFFVITYHIIWQNGVLEISRVSSIILGICSGIIGILGWMLLFTIIPNKPDIDYKGYYIQLFIAHIIFAVTAFLVYRLFL